MNHSSPDVRIKFRVSTASSYAAGRRCSGARRYSTEAMTAGTAAETAAQKSWNMVLAALATMNPLPWKKMMRGSFGVFGWEDSAIRGRNKRSQVLFVWLIMMSFVRTGRVGSKEGGMFGIWRMRVRVPSGFRTISRWRNGSIGCCR